MYCLAYFYTVSRDNGVMPAGSRYRRPYVRPSRNVPRTNGWTYTRRFLHTYTHGQSKFTCRSKFTCSSKFACQSKFACPSKFAFVLPIAIKILIFLDLNIQGKISNQVYSEVHLGDCLANGDGWDKHCRCQHIRNRVWPFHRHIYLWPWHVIEVNIKVIHICDV